MPHMTFKTSADGYALTVLVGLNGKQTVALVAAHQPVPAPFWLRALLDGGSDVTWVATRVLQQLGATRIAGVSNQTMAGMAPVNLFEVSLSVPPSGHLTGSLLHQEQLVVVEMTQPLPNNIEVLIGRDILDQCLFISDGPRGEFTFGD
jgi:hypothetical protein